MRIWSLCLLLVMGCTMLPPRSGGLAGDVRYSWVGKTPRGMLATCNVWCRPDSCPGVKAWVKVDEAGKVTEAGCEPLP